TMHATANRRRNARRDVSGCTREAECTGGDMRVFGHVASVHRINTTSVVRPERSSLDGESEVAREDQSLDLARSLTDLQDLRVAVEAAHRRFVDVAVAAVDLHRFAGGGDRDLARVELRHRR